MRHDDPSAVVRTAIPAGAVMRAALLGGFAFVLFKMAVAQLLGGGIFAPLRLIGAMVLGENTLPASSSIEITLVAALSVHLVLSLLYAAVFSVLVAVTPPLRQSRTIVLAAGCAMGLILWGMNLHLFAPLFFPWFIEDHRPLVEIAARVLFFGLPVGLVVSRALPPRVSIGPRSVPREVLGTDRSSMADND